MKHGEKIAYPVLLIKEHLESLLLQPDLKLHISYDIACILKRHLESSKQESLLEKFSLALPAFHTYAHRPSCQIALGAKYCNQNGMTDGEQCERLWSYLRCFSSITKEMSAANRKDLLTDALYYYGTKKIEKMPMLLCKRLAKAQKQAAESEEHLKKLLDSLPILVSFDDVSCWVEEQRKGVFPETESLPDDAIAWQRQYVHKILYNRQLRQSLMMDNATEETVVKNVSLLRSSEKDLKEFEKLYNIKRRWDLSADGVKELVCEVIDTERIELVRSLRIMAFERSFLLSLKRKYADGQKLAKSLSSSINKKVLSIEKLLQPFNKKVLYLNSFIPGMREKVIEKRMAFDMDSEMYTQLEIVNVDPRIPICLKVKAVNLYLTWERSLEEITLLDRDAENVIAFILHERQMLQSAIGNLAGTSSYIIGSRSLLYEELSRLTFFAAKTISLFEETNFLCKRSMIDLERIRKEIQERQASVLNISMMEYDLHFHEPEVDEDMEEDVEIEHSASEENLLDNDLFAY